MGIWFWGIWLHGLVGIIFKDGATSNRSWQNILMTVGRLTSSLFLVSFFKNVRELKALSSIINVKHNKGGGILGVA
jgi:hypothetical protein